MSFLPHFLYTIYVWLNYPLVRNMHKVCAAGRYAPNKQSTNNTNSTKKSQPGLTKVSPPGAPEFTPFISWVRVS
jgi:hypothetical protein